MSIQASLDYEAVNRIEQWVQRLECVGYQIEQAIGKMQPCQKTDVNAGTARGMTTTDSVAETSGTSSVESAPTVAASITAQPSRPKTSVDDASTTGPTTSMYMVALPESTTGMASVQNASVSHSAPPSEPKLVWTAREMARFGLSPAADINQACVAYIDTISARLKRAEELLQRAAPFVSDSGHMERVMIDAFLAGKG